MIRHEFSNAIPARFAMSSYQDYSDLELLSLVKQDDSEAFGEVYKRFAKRLVSYARKNVGVKEDCEEIVQDVFESLWNRRSELLILNLSAYLFNAVRYKVIRYFRESEVKRRYEDHYRVFEVLYENSDELQMSPAEASVIIQKCVAGLPKRYREVMRLKFFQQLSDAEIAQQLNLTQQTVEVYLSNALSGLRAVYQSSKS